MYVSSREAQGTMNKDLRLARKGPPTGFGHGRRHSCLGYVPKQRILHLVSAHTHEREKSYCILRNPASRMSHSVKLQSSFLLKRKGHFQEERDLCTSDFFFFHF